MNYLKNLDFLNYNDMQYLIFIFVFLKIFSLLTIICMLMNVECGVINFRIAAGHQKDQSVY